MEHWYRKQLRELYGSEFLQKMDDASMRIEAKNTPTSGPSGECPECKGPLTFLHKQNTHYCAICDAEYKDVDTCGRPIGEPIRSPV